MVKQYQLRGHSGPVANRVIKLVEQAITLGRDLSNDVVIGDSEVSRAHARLSWQGVGHMIEDLRSTNGTWINGRPVVRASMLVAGDLVTLGKVSVFAYELVPAPEADPSEDGDDEDSSDLAESTMLMPAWQESAGKAREAIKARPPAQPEEASPPGRAAAGAQPGPLPTDSSPGRLFHQKYVACLQAGDVQGLLSHYHPDAVLLSTDAAFAGTAGIATFFGQHFSGAGSFRIKPTGKYVEGRDAILCESHVETVDRIVLLRDVFVFRDGKVAHQFTCTVETIPTVHAPDISTDRFSPP